MVGKADGLLPHQNLWSSGGREDYPLQMCRQVMRRARKERPTGGRSSGVGIADARGTDSPPRGSFSLRWLGSMFLTGIQLGEHRLALLS